MPEPAVGLGGQRARVQGVRQGGVVANAFVLIRFGGTFLNWVADFGPNGAQQGGVAAIGQPEEQGPGLQEHRALAQENAADELAAGVVAGGQPAAAIPAGDLAEDDARGDLEELPQVHVEAGIVATVWELLAYAMAVLRAWVVHLPVYSVLGFFVIVFGVGVSFGAFMGSGKGAPAMAPFHVAMVGSDHAAQIHRYVLRLVECGLVLWLFHYRLVWKSFILQSTWPGADGIRSVW